MPALCQHYASLLGVTKGIHLFCSRSDWLPGNITHPWFAPYGFLFGSDMDTQQQQQLFLLLVVASAVEVAFAVDVDVVDADEGDVMADVNEDSEVDEEELSSNEAVYKN